MEEDEGATAGLLRDRDRGGGGGAGGTSKGGVRVGSGDSSLSGGGHGGGGSAGGKVSPVDGAAKVPPGSADASAANANDAWANSTLKLGDRSFLEGPAWARPDVAAGFAKRRASMFRGGGAAVCTCRLWDVDEMGAGVGLYFRVLVYLFAFFCVATLVVAPVFTVSAAGKRLDPEELDPLRAGLLSLANVGDRQAGVNYTLTAGGLHYTALELADMWMITDFVVVVLLVAAVAVMMLLAAKARATIDAGNYTADDYTVLVTGLPPEVTEAAVAAHFNALYNLSAPDWTFPSRCTRCCWCGRKMWRRAVYARDAPLTAPVKVFRSMAAGLQVGDDSLKPVPDNSRMLADGDVAPVPGAFHSPAPLLPLRY